MLYRSLSSYFKERYGKRVSKICIDGGFSCPNRDGRCGVGGCIYCGERGAGEHINGSLAISEQVSSQISACRDETRGFVAYFQNFTNTYAPVSTLRQRYDAALISPRIVALAIGTRPDCIDERVAELIASYKGRVDVWVELGLQTASDRTARVINRGYETDVFFRAVRLLHSFGIDVVAHMIIGLPGEGETEVDATVDAINASGVSGVKIHSMYVAEGTALAEMYRRGDYLPLEEVEYARLAARSIARLRPSTVVHRITGDCPRELLVAPPWNADKSRVISLIKKQLADMGARQGSLYVGYENT
ncbi:MAG: TIGR01212 family radical SAM protein [Clostridia bacterium]|nr:TIGR01212 family radical SAM protein [Clostridia bacterium]